MKSSFVLQDIVLNQIRREKRVCEVLLTSGTSVFGGIRGFDNQTVIMDVDDGKQIMIYKSNIILIQTDFQTLTENRQNTKENYDSTRN